MSTCQHILVALTNKLIPYISILSPRPLPIFPGQFQLHGFTYIYIQMTIQSVCPCSCWSPDAKFTTAYWIAPFASPMGNSNSTFKMELISFSNFFISPILKIKLCLKHVTFILSFYFTSFSIPERIFILKYPLFILPHI